MGEVTASNASSQEVTGELSVKQKQAAEWVARGYSDTQVAEEVKVARETVWRWRHQNPTFQEEVEEARKRLLPGEASTEETELVEQVREIPLLSLEGIKVRLELKDRLLLTDLPGYDEKRVRLIQRLETDIEQANKFMDALMGDEGISVRLSFVLDEYKRQVLGALLEALDSSVDAQVKQAILDEFKAAMGKIEGRRGDG